MFEHSRGLPPIDHNINMLAACCKEIRFPSGVVFRASPHRPAATQHRSLTPFNLHRARVRRNHGRLDSDGSIANARKAARPSGHFCENAPPIEL